MIFVEPNDDEYPAELPNTKVVRIQEDIFCHGTHLRCFLMAHERYINVGKGGLYDLSLQFRG